MRLPTAQAMDVNYGRRPPYSLGIEEEFQLVHSESFELVPQIDEVLAALEGDESQAQVKEELWQSFVEIATPVTTSVRQAVGELRKLRRRVDAAARRRQARIASSGTHPFSLYEHQRITERPRYADMKGSFGWVADRQLIFGMHVHVGLDTADKAIACGNALRTFLPELLALSANSPFWQARDTGLASTRSRIFEDLLRSGLPPAFESFEEFERLVARGIRTGTFPDYTHIWWDVRPHPRLGTVEVRICDVQTRIASVAALAALIQSLVASFGESFERGERLPVEPELLIEESKWRAARDVVQATLIDLAADGEHSAREAILALVERSERQARKLGCAEELALVEDILSRGSGSDEQRRIYEETGSLLAVAQWVAAESVTGL
jgi:carboxylate-amine ligase